MIEKHEIFSKTQVHICDNRKNKKKTWYKIKLLYIWENKRVYSAPREQLPLTIMQMQDLTSNQIPINAHKHIRARPGVTSTSRKHARFIEILILIAISHI